MKSDLQIMNELAVQSEYLRPITEDESFAFKQLLLEMYSDITKLCDRYGFEYMLGGGSCLGAIRHHGFIPWDDDLDLMMPRLSYEGLVRCCKNGELGDKYEISVPEKDHDTRNLFLKIFRRNTLDIELQNENTPFPKGVFIDVFPMDSAPRNKLLRRIKGVISDSLKMICTSVFYSEYPSEKYQEFVSLNVEAKRRFKTRVLLGRVFGIIKHKKWVWWFDRFNYSTKQTGFITIPAGRKGYYGEVQPSHVFFPVQQTKFEGISTNIPSNSDAYLSRLYHNYLEIPPIEKRERHLVYLFKL